MTKTKNLGIYIHIPFCVKKCKYCGFLSFPNMDKNVIAQYVNSLKREIKAWEERIQEEYIIDTIFMGGGTPSILEIEQIKGILELIPNKTKDCEITMEANPKTFNSEDLQGYKEAGINRLSIGIQSFDVGLLRTIGRIHSSSEGEKAFKMARKAGLDNINIDLMFSLPGQSIEKWEKTLKKAVKLGPDHISFYGLQIEENTPFYKSFKNDEYDFPGIETEKEMYYKALDILKNAGYVHYEISNSARDFDHICKHNMKYWTMKEYLGLGLGASSFYGGKRFQNTSNLDEYLNKIDYLAVYNNARPEGIKDIAGETVFTGLRLIDGLDLGIFKEKVGEDFWKFYRPIQSTIKNYLQTNSLVFDESSNKIKIHKDSIMKSNSIMSEFVFTSDEK